jgi:hypothetical protein
MLLCTELVQGESLLREGISTHASSTNGVPYPGPITILTKGSRPRSGPPHHHGAAVSGAQTIMP